MAENEEMKREITQKYLALEYKDTQLPRCIKPYGKELRTPILGSLYRVPCETLDCYIEPAILDNSSPQIAVYSHLKIYDPQPIARPNTPPSILSLRSKSMCERNSDQLSALTQSQINGKKDLDTSTFLSDVLKRF